MPRYGNRGQTDYRGTERFFDERLTSQQNKAVEMARNNFSTSQIADEIDITEAHARVLLNQARTRGVDSPRAPNAGMTSDWTTPQLIAMEERGLTRQQISARTGLSMNNLRQRLWQGRRHSVRTDDPQLPTARPGPKPTDQKNQTPPRKRGFFMPRRY